MVKNVESSPVVEQEDARSFERIMGLGALVRASFPENVRGMHEADAACMLLRKIGRGLAQLQEGEYIQVWMRESGVGLMVDQDVEGEGWDARSVAGRLLLYAMQSLRVFTLEEQKLNDKLLSKRDYDWVVTGDPWDVWNDLRLIWDYPDEVYENKGGGGDKSMGEVFSQILFGSRVFEYEDVNGESTWYLPLAGDESYRLKVTESRYSDSGQKYVQFAVLERKMDGIGRDHEQEQVIFRLEMHSDRSMVLKQLSPYTVASWQRALAPLLGIEFYEGELMADRLAGNASLVSLNQEVPANLRMLSYKPLGTVQNRDEIWFGLAKEGLEVMQSPLALLAEFEQMSLETRIQTIYRLLPMLMEGERRVLSAGNGQKGMIDLEMPALSERALEMIWRTVLEARVDIGWRDQLDLSMLAQEEMIAYAINPFRFARYFEGMGLNELVDRTLKKFDEKTEVMKLVEQMGVRMKKSLEVKTWLTEEEKQLSNEQLWDVVMRHLQACDQGETDPKLTLAQWLGVGGRQSEAVQMSELLRVFKPNLI